MSGGPLKEAGFFVLFFLPVSEAQAPNKNLKLFYFLLSDVLQKVTILREAYCHGKPYPWIKLEGIEKCRFDLESLTFEERNYLEHLQTEASYDNSITLAMFEDWKKREKVYPSPATRTRSTSTTTTTPVTPVSEEEPDYDVTERSTTTSTRAPLGLGSSNTPPMATTTTIRYSLADVRKVIDELLSILPRPMPITSSSRPSTTPSMEPTETAVTG